MIGEEEGEGIVGQKVVYVRELPRTESDSSGPPTSEEDGEAWLESNKV